MASFSAEATWRRKLFLKDDFSDCEIVVVTQSSSYRFPCHRAILSSANDVFAKMFEYDCQEQNTGKITIRDTSPSDMLSILKYIYTGCIYIKDWRVACDILKFAHKYNMCELWEECEEFLSENLTLDNVCRILEFSSLYDLAKLKSQCLRLCSKAFFAMVRRKTFMELNLSAMKEILCRQDLNVESEMTVFQVAWDRAILECCRKERKVTNENIVDEMKVFLDCIGFEFMTDEEKKSLPNVVYQLLPDIQNKSALSEEDSKISVDNMLVPTSESSNCYSAHNLDKRGVQFPLGLQNHLSVFKMSVAQSGSSSTGSLLLKLSLTSFVYLHDITILCYRNSASDLPCKSDNVTNKSNFLFGSVFPDSAASTSSNMGGHSVFTFVSRGTDTSSTKLTDFYKPRHLSLRVTNGDRSMELPCKKILNSFICQNQFVNQLCYPKVSREIYKLKFEAASLLLLDAGVQYTFEIRKSLDSPLNCTLTWPMVLPKRRNSKEVQLKFHTMEYYGLYKLKVIDAS